MDETCLSPCPFCNQALIKGSHTVLLGDPALICYTIMKCDDRFSTSSLRPINRTCISGRARELMPPYNLNLIRTERGIDSGGFNGNGYTTFEHQFSCICDHRPVI